MDEYDDMYGQYNYGNQEYYQPQKQVSKYQVIPLLNVFKQISDMVTQTSQTVALPFGWSLLLLKEFKWQPDNIGNYFQKMNQYKNTIGYSAKLMTTDNAKKQMKQGQCGVCYEKNKTLVMNICKDKFCSSCWANHILQHINNKNPFMKCMNCKTPLLHQIIRDILNDPKSPQYIKTYKKYQKVICQFFTNTNRSYRCCPGIDCNYCIKCDNYSVTTVKCMCGKSFCFRCNNDDHSPCTCSQSARWIDIVLKQQANAKWIAQNAKLCPWCNKAVQRSKGCNFMACLCGKNFCYMCSKPWQPDHKDHFKCHIYVKKADEEIKKAKDVLQKLNFFAEKYLHTNALVKQLRSIDTFEKRRLLYNKLIISLSQSDFIQDAYKFAIECCQSLKWIYVYHYFVQFLDKNRKQRFQFSQGQYQSFKQNLMKKLSYDLKQFIDNLQKQCKDNNGTLNQKKHKQLKQQFQKLKSNIINYYKFTKQFKQKFVEQLQSIDQSLIRRNDQQKSPQIADKKTNTKTKNKWF